MLHAPSCLCYLTPGLSYYLFLHPCLSRIPRIFFIFSLLPSTPTPLLGHFVTYFLPSLYARSPAHLAYIIITAPLFPSSTVFNFPFLIVCPVFLTSRICIGSFM